MRRLLVWLVCVAIVASGIAVAVVAWRVSAPRPAFASDDPRFGKQGDAQRGALVFAAADCGSCHASPGQSDPLRLGGGMSLGSPFGTFRPPNISPDPDDGIGRWRAVDLANALVSGISPSGEHLYPALPYTSYAHMSTDDIVDLMAYLRTLPKISGRTPPHDLHFPFTVRRFVGLWKALYLDTTPIEPLPTADKVWSRGRYLVEALGHCAECHSTRSISGAIVPKDRYAGGPDQEGVGFIPNITPDAIGSWSLDDIVEMLTSGRMPDQRFVGSSMVSVVDNTRQLSPEDRRAIAVYLKSLPPRKTPAPS